MTFRSPLFASMTLLALSLSSCSEETKQETDTATGIATESPAMPTMVDPSAVQPVAEDPASSGPLNPAHGEPGHRCEIAVGAPLNSAPTGASTTITPNITPTTSPVAMPTSGGSGKLNPAHGEPGHDCAVPVGSPLPG